MALELFVTHSDPGDRTQPWIDVLLWSIGDDPKLIEAVRFTGGVELRVWVKAIRAEHGDPHRAVDAGPQGESGALPPGRGPRRHDSSDMACSEETTRNKPSCACSLASALYSVEGDLRRG